MTGSFVDRWLFRGAGDMSPSASRRLISQVAALTVALIVALLVNKTIVDYLPLIWIFLVIVLALAMWRLDYGPAAKPAVRLWQWLGAFSALYALLCYPLMPPLPERSAEALYAVLLGLWVLSLLAGIACFRVPSLAMLPPAFLVWSKIITQHITGLRHFQTLDVAPLPEVSLGIGLGLAIAALVRHYRARRAAQAEAASGNLDPASEFERIVLVIAICIHLANYFWSSLAKATLHGPFLSWIYLNNPLNIFITALDDGHVTFSPYPSVVRWVAWFIDVTHVPSNAILFFVQGIALFGMALPKRGLILLLVAFDAMHIGIAIAAGANFWPWVVLNLVIAGVVTRREYQQPRLLVGLGAAAFICLSPAVANVAKLGWYDSGANNDAYMEAVDRSGRRHFVSTNFFTFYSFPMAHMRYGMPQPETAIDVGNPNGGTRDYPIVEAARTCNTTALIRPGSVGGMPQADFARFVIDYHAMAKSIEHRLGVFPYDFYPHHFYMRPSLMDDYDALDKDDIVAYIYHRDSVCLQLVDGRIHRRVVSTGEFRIDLPHG